jgi:GAF domain-containing protein/HAMP domain-containing protein
MGGLYIVFVVLLGQLISGPVGIIVAALLLKANAELTTAQLTRLAIATGLLMVIRDIFLLTFTHLTNRAAVSRLWKWARGKTLESGSEEERLAWKQISSLPWRYIGIAFISLIFFVLPLSSAYLFYTMKGTLDQVFYLIFAAIVSGLSNALFEVMFIELSLSGARKTLIPQGFDFQVKGVAGLHLATKFLIAFLALIIITILAIAPIGYHQTTVVLYEEIGSQKVLANLQLQSILVGVFSLLLGIGLSAIITGTISRPIRQMISTFGKIEEGDLKQRVPVMATDEVGELAVYFNHMIARMEGLQNNLERRVVERTEQLKTTIEVGRAATTSLNPDELINKVVNLITDRFGYYYTAIFLTEPSGRWAELKGATGTAGKTLMAQGHRLPLGGKSMVSMAITTRQGRIALDVGVEPSRFENPLLPDTRSEIALPLIVGDQVIGSLDVQSTQEAAFREEDIDTLQGMSNQVAIALENARLFQETQKSFEELRIANRLYITKSWSEKALEHANFEYTASSEAGRQGEAVNNVDVPLTLRDQVIGQLHLEGQQEWTQEERNLIESVATQAALALENARLLEESQQLALRERLAAEITGKIWSSPNTEYILQTAVKELGRALRADEATIELKLD